MSVSTRTRAALWMAIAQLLSSSVALGIRYSSAHVPWQEVGAIRFWVGALAAWAAARLSGQSLLAVQHRRVWPRSLYGTLAATGTFYTLSSPQLHLGDAATLFQTTPVWIAALSPWLLRERPDRGVTMCIALAFLGVLAIATPTFDSAPHLVAAGMTTALCSALAMITLRKIGPEESAAAIVFHFSVVAAGVLTFLASFVWKAPDLRTGVVLALTGLGAGLAQLAITRAYALDAAARVATVSYLGVVFTHVGSLFVFGDRPSTLGMFGALLVIAAGLLLTVIKSSAKG